MNTGTFGEGNRVAPKTCCLCGKIYSEYGNNPAPLRSEGRCCDECNTNKVIPRRIADMRAQ